MAKSIDQNIDAWARQFAARMSDPRIFERAIPDIRQTIQTSIEDNFRAGGRYGNDNPWGGGSQSWAPTKRGGRILQDTSDLIHSIDVIVRLESDGLVIEINVGKTYAAIHQFGGKTGRNRSVTLPPRPYAVIQNEDIEMIVEILMEEMTREF